MNRFALILAGGKGTRLWPLSRENYPKQFVEFKDGLSLFQMTIRRLLSSFGPENIFIISQDTYKFTLHNQIELLPGIHAKEKVILKNNVLIEPHPKNTLPAILLAVKFIEDQRKTSDETLFYVFPSDHVIEPVSEFKKCLQKAAQLAECDKIVVFGVTPTFPKEGYGYVLVDGKLGSGFMVKGFVEKPTLKKAEKLMTQGAFWNAGIFTFSKKAFLEELAAFQPHLFDAYSLGFAQFLKDFRSISANSIDYGIMQKTEKCALVKFTVRWTDLGSWDSFLQFRGGKSKNFQVGKAEFLGSSNCFTYSKNRLICLVGLKDVIAIDSNDSLLLVKKGCSDRVKELVSLINKKGYEQSKDSATVYRPWGYYSILHEGAGYKVKEIGVYPKKSVSLQKHQYRSEHWNVVEGRVQVSVDGNQTEVNKNQSVYVPRGKKHRVYNPAAKTAKIIEVQIGAYLGEDDIQRFSKYE